MNPPFSVKSWTNGLENDYGRFEFGIPPAKNGDYAFLLHVLKSLKSTGKAAIILPHGVLFRGNAEADIRKELLRRGYIKGDHRPAANLFYGTGIPACIVVLDKENAQARTGVFMIDACKGFMKDGPKNRLRSQDIHKIVDVFNNQIEIDALLAHGARCTRSPAEANDYNLNIPRYIDSSEPEDLQDLDAHLHGGIPDRDIDALAPTGTPSRAADGAVQAEPARLHATSPSTSNAGPADHPRVRRVPDIRRRRAADVTATGSPRTGRRWRRSTPTPDRTT